LPPKRSFPSPHAPFCYCQRRRAHGAELSGSGPISTATCSTPLAS
jgi:hypothetical protein